MLAQINKWFYQRVNRMHWWAAISIILVFIICLIAPQQVPVLINKIMLLTVASYVAYWIDRTAFPYARPDHVLETEGSHAAALATLRRAIIMAAAMIAVAIGL